MVNIWLIYCHGHFYNQTVVFRMGKTASTCHIVQLLGDYVCQGDERETLTIS